MEARQKISVSIPPTMLAKVEAAAKTGDYANTNHVINDALLWWEESHKTPEERQAWLRQAIQDGLDSGPAIEGTVEELFEGVKRRGRERLARERKAA
jgi:antitoxin ParD1/3/4